MNISKVLVIDDHPVVLEGLRSVLSAEGYQVLKAGTSEDALSLVEENEDIELLVVDLTLRKDADGLELIKDIRRLRPGMSAVIYTMHEEMWNIAMLIDADVEGVVLKGEDVRELIESVRLVGKGAIYRSPEFCERFESAKKARGILSRTDLDVLRLISDGLSSSEISKKINLSDKSVEYHRSNIIKKLGTKNMTEAIRNAVKLGIISCTALFAPFASNAVDNVPVPVDLGLSVQWGDRNLGAPSILEPGGYFAFGEVEEKDVYDWTTYLNCDEEDEFSQHYIGDESIAGTEYDAAVYSLGPDWRIPTGDEITELIENCTYEIMEAEGRMYGRFTSANGNTIDIPFVGYMSNDHLLYDNREGYVWSASFWVEEGEEDGFVYRVNGPEFLGMTTSQPVAGLYESSSHLGFQIRPVYVGNTGVSSIPDAGSDEDVVYTIDGRRVKAPTAPGLYIINGRKHFLR